MSFVQGFPISSVGSESATTEPCKILIADNEEEVHLVTRMVLDDFQFEGRRFELISSYNEEETKRVLRENPDIALVLLDVVMDTEHSGLDIVHFVRTELKNPFLRIILRTGQPGRAPENKVIIEYDINDYKEKTELTSQKLRTAIIAALRAYRDLRVIQREQRRLDEAWRFLTQIIHSLNTMLIVVDSDLKVSLWNSAAEEYSSIPSKKAVGKQLVEILPWANGWSSALDEALRLGVPRELHRVPASPGELAYLDVRIYPLRQEASEGLVILVDDVTELRWKEEQLRRSQKLEAVGSLSSGLAHDINNILGGITGAISLIEFERSTAPALHNENYNPYLSTIHDSAERASSLVQRLLALTRRSEVKSDPIDLNRVVRNVMRVCESSFDKVIDLRAEFSPDPAVILGDYSQMEQVLLNLCINAAHAMTIMREPGERQGGLLRVSVSRLSGSGKVVSGNDSFRKHGGWLLAISDQGVGIPKEVIGKIFDPFFTTKKDASGTGLGLSMVHNIVNQFQGIIDVETEVGAGSTIKLYFPSSAGIQEDDPEKIMVNIPSGAGTVLLCDDEELMRRVGCKILEKCGYSTITAYDGEDAIRVFKEHQSKIDVVILDMLMPKLSGVDVYRAMKELDSEVKVILSSGFRDDERVKTVLSEGAQAFLEKPYTMEKLANTLKQVLSGE